MEHDGRNLIGQAIRNNIGEGDDYSADCLLDYHYFKRTVNWLQ